MVRCGGALTSLRCVRVCAGASDAQKQLRAGGRAGTHEVSPLVLAELPALKVLRIPPVVSACCAIGVGCIS